MKGVITILRIINEYNTFGDLGQAITKEYAEWFAVEWEKVTSELKPKLEKHDIVLTCVKPIL